MLLRASFADIEKLMLARAIGEVLVNAGVGECRNVSGGVYL